MAKRKRGQKVHLWGNKLRGHSSFYKISCLRDKIFLCVHFWCLIIPFVSGTRKKTCKQRYREVIMNSNKIPENIIKHMCSYCVSKLFILNNISTIRFHCPVCGFDLCSQCADAKQSSVDWNKLCVHQIEFAKSKHRTHRVAKTLSARQQYWPESFCKYGKFLRQVHNWLVVNDTLVF